MHIMRFLLTLITLFLLAIQAQSESFEEAELKGNGICCREDKGRIVRRFPRKQPEVLDPNDPKCKCNLQKSSFEWVGQWPFLVSVRSTALGCDNPLVIYDNGNIILNTGEGIKCTDITVGTGYHMVRMYVQGCLADDTVNVSIYGTSCPSGSNPINCFKLGPHIVCFCELVAE